MPEISNYGKELDMIKDREGGQSTAMTPCASTTSNRFVQS
jgi:hypothetical protein